MQIEVSGNTVDIAASAEEVGELARLAGIGGMYEREGLSPGGSCLSKQNMQLAPQVLYLGVGCRRGTDAEHLETVFQRFCGERKLLPEAIRGAASIDLKADEPGLLAFCQSHAWPLTCFDAETLASLEGDYSTSEFVKSTVGVDNVCERSAVLASGGELIEKKYAFDGVTFALALRTPELEWSW